MNITIQSLKKVTMSKPVKKVGVKNSIFAVVTTVYSVTPIKVKSYVFHNTVEILYGGAQMLEPKTFIPGAVTIARSVCDLYIKTQNRKAA